MSVIDAIIERLNRYPDISYRSTDCSIHIDAPGPTGFSVSLIVDKPALLDSQRFTVCLDGWHEEFDSEEEALNCFVFGLSDSCRLQVVRRCGREYRWTLEYRDGHEWKTESTTALLFFPFWCRREIVYRQNCLMRG